jgi:guanine nucleotide-binding protein G(i) subunit alpha
MYCSYFAEAQRITAEDYVPSIEDIGHSTSEQRVIETHFDVDQLSLRVLQVYGQQSWRRKWMRLFEGVTSVMFCASLSDYDEPAGGTSSSDRQVCASTFRFYLDNDDTCDHGSYQTRLAECFGLFEEVVNSSWFRKTSIIIFLTGMHEFRAKLQEVR